MKRNNIFNTLFYDDNKHLQSMLVLWANTASLIRHFLLKCLYQARKVSGRVYAC